MCHPLAVSTCPIQRIQDPQQSLMLHGSFVSGYVEDLVHEGLDVGGYTGGGKPWALVDILDRGSSHTDPT